LINQFFFLQNNKFFKSLLLNTCELSRFRWEKDVLKTPDLKRWTVRILFTKTCNIVAVLQKNLIRIHFLNQNCFRKNTRNFMSFQVKVSKWASIHPDIQTPKEEILICNLFECLDLLDSVLQVISPLQFQIPPNPFVPFFSISYFGPARLNRKWNLLKVSSKQRTRTIKDETCCFSIQERKHLLIPLCHKSNNKIFKTCTLLEKKAMKIVRTRYRDDWATKFVRLNKGFHKLGKK